MKHRLIVHFLLAALCMAHAFSSVAAQTKDKPNHGLHTKGNAWWMAGGVTGPRRPNMFENSIRVPLLVRWPGTVKPGTVINEVAGNPDTFATVLGMLKLPMPKNVKQEGADFSPLLRRRNWPNLVLPASEKFVPTDVDFAHPIYETSFDDPAVLKDWKLEGGKQMSVAGGNLALESGGRNNHLVCWLRKEAPADFLLEFTFRPQHRQEGLAIVFFNARGLKGESIFDQALAPRDGTFDQYHSGDLNNYHISYWAAGRETAHIRKNKGFQLVAQGKDLVAPAPADAFQTIRVYKRGGKIRLIVDNMVAVADDDDGQTYGPVHTHAGWIGLRQMGHAVRGEYGHLKLFPLTAASAKDESRQAPAATT